MTKTRGKLDEIMFNRIKNLFSSAKVSEIATITGFSRNRIYQIKMYCETEDITAFDKFMKKKGKKKKDTRHIEEKIREIFSRDPSQTQVAVRKVLEDEGITISKSRFNSLVRQSGLVRKRSKRLNISLTPELQLKRAEYATIIQNIENKQLVYLYEMGFNMHVSNHYGYVTKEENHAPVIERPIKPCVALYGLFSLDGLIAFDVVDGLFNKERFLPFIEKCVSKGKLLSNDHIVIMDMSRLQYSIEIAEYLQSAQISCMSLPPKSSDLNPTVDVFSLLKTKVANYRPIAGNKEALKNDVNNSVKEFNHKGNQYYLTFFENMWNNVKNIVDQQKIIQKIK